MTTNKEQSKINTFNLIKIPELSIEITKPIPWTKPYNEIVCPKGFRKIKIWELIYIFESDYCDEFLGKDKDEWISVWCEQTKYAKKNNYAVRSYRAGIGYWCADSGDLAVSGAYARVVFVRDLK
jgi:hypothetical protein